MEMAEPAKEVEMEMDEEEMQLVEEGMRAAQLEENEGAAQVKVAGDDEAPMRIAKNYKRPEERIPAERDPTKFVVSPITGELIPISEMEEHMRISLIDPKYKEQKERMLAKFRRPPLHLMMRFQGALLVLLALALIFLGPPRRRFLMLLRQKLKRKGMSSRSRLFGMVILVALVGLLLMHCHRVVRNSLILQMLMGDLFLAHLHLSDLACSHCPDLLSHFLLLMFLALSLHKHNILAHRRFLICLEFRR